MKVTTLPIADPESRRLDPPVIIVLETVGELNLANDTFARSIHHKDVTEDSVEQKFNSKVYNELNVHCAKYRR